MNDIPENNEKLLKLINDLDDSKNKPKHGCMYWTLLIAFSLLIDLWNAAVLSYASLLIWKMHITPDLDYTPSYFVFIGVFYIISLLRLPSGLGNKQEFMVDSFAKAMGIALAITFFASVLTGLAWLFTIFI